jgi:hypothetical protein
MPTSKIPLRLYYSDALIDNATMAGESEGWATGAGYRLASTLGYILKEQLPGTIPLNLYYSEQLSDNATMAGEAEGWASGAGYRLAATLGYLFKEPQPGTIPLRLYYSEQHTDNATMAGETEGWATGAGYRLAATLGYIYPNTPAVMSSFNPAQHGFKFVNSFINDFIPALDIRTGGLCGGMSYAALDYYFARLPMPSQQFRPANGTTLHSYLYDRQVTSIVSNVDKWTEIGVNPFGARDTEFFNWGISARKGERIDELKQFLDKGTPCVIGLQGHGSTSQHQMIAIGYEMGRYQGDLGAYIEDFKIFVCDPNAPEVTRTLIPDVSRRLYRFQDGGPETWRTYFVDKNYHPQRPPTINANYPRDNRVYELVLQFGTGGDDLRGGNDNVDLVVNLTDGTQQTYRNINLGSRWVVNNDESAEVILQRAVRQEELRSLVISTTFGGGLGGDNW